MAQVVGLAADLRSTLQLSDYSQASVRPALVREGAAIDLETTPYATLRFDWDRSNVSLGYGPRFMLRDVLEDRSELTLHGGYVSYFHAWPRYRFTLTESASYGEQNLLTLTFLAPPQVSATPQSSPAVNRLGPVQTVKVGSELTSATLEYAWTHRLGLTFNASYGISGGIDAVEQETLPRQYTAQGSAWADYALTKEDNLGTGVGVSHTLASSGFDTWLVTATERWRHKLNREMSSSVSAGVGWYTSKGPDGARDAGLFPVVSLGLDGVWTIVRRRAYVVTLQVGSTVVPTIDVYTGKLQERASAFSTLGIANKTSSLSGTLSGSQSFPLSEGVSLVGVGFLATHSPAKFVEISAGYRTVWQSPNTLPTGRMWTAFLGLTLYAPPVRF
jgi:hypothetical protein